MKANSKVLFISLLVLGFIIPSLVLDHDRGLVLSCPGGGGNCEEDNFSLANPGAGCQDIDNGDWVKYEGNPVFLKGEPGEWDSAGVTCFVVRHFPHAYMMWYSISGQWARGFGLARSRDGIDWVRHGDGGVMVPDSGVTVWGPEVLYDGELYRMWYVSRGLDGEMDGISYCTSGDGIEWTQSENNPVIDHGGCNAVIWDDENEQYRMFLQGSIRIDRQPRSAFELLTSEDGENWESQGHPFVTGPVGSWDEITAAPSIAFYENQLHLWYTGADTQGNRRGEIAIGHVVSGDWGESFENDSRDRTVYRELRPNPRLGWEGRGLYSSGVDYDGENIYIWYAATGPDGGFGYASRPVNTVRPQTEIRNTLNLWTVSPNPSAGPVKINYLGTMDAAVTVGLYDLSGRRLLYREFAANQPVRIDPSSADLPIGQYLLRINARGNEIHKRMVLVK